MTSPTPEERRQWREYAERLYYASPDVTLRLLDALEAAEADMRKLLRHTEYHEPDPDSLTGEARAICTPCGGIIQPDFYYAPCEVCAIRARYTAPDAEGVSDA